MEYSRRRFVELSAGAAALAVVGGGRSLGAQRIGVAPGRGSGAALLAFREDDPEVARAVAMTAIDAARRAGASFVDIRVDASVSQSVSVWQGRASGPVRFSDRFEYGVRVLVNGQWGFAGDQDPATDTVAACAQRAVAQARAASRDAWKAVALAAAPVVRDGTWATRVDVDPFRVPIGEQEDVLVRAVRAARTVRRVTDAGGSLEFARTARTFASSEGSVIAQTIVVGTPGFTAYATAVDDSRYTVGQRVFALEAAQRGYELVRDAGLEARAVEAAEAAVRATAARPIDVGRYDVVVSARVMASMLGALCGTAMDGELGRGVAVPLVTVVGDRSLAAGLGTVGWDDEGVAPETFTIVEAGVAVDRPTTRASAVEMGAWSLARAPGRAIGSHGCAVGGGLSAPWASLPNLALTPARESIGVHELISGVRRGLYFSGDAWGGGGSSPTDVEQWSASAVQEIRDGRLVGFVRDAALQMRHGDLWQALDAMGGEASVERAAVGGATVRAVPGRFRRMNIISTGAVI